MADPNMPAEGESFLQEVVDSTWQMAREVYQNGVGPKNEDATLRQARAEQHLRDYIKQLYAAVRVRR